MRAVVYHSAEWGTLVETGWVTHTVEESSVPGIRIALMIYCPARRY